MSVSYFIKKTCHWTHQQDRNFFCNHWKCHLLGFGIHVSFLFYLTAKNSQLYQYSEILSSLGKESYSGVCIWWSNTMSVYSLDFIWLLSSPLHVFLSMSRRNERRFMATFHTLSFKPHHLSGKPERTLVEKRESALPRPHHFII